MNRRIDYKKKLMDYRRSMGIITKSVGFKDVTPQPTDEKQMGGIGLEEARPTIPISTLLHDDNIKMARDSNRAVSPSPQMDKLFEVPSEKSMLYEPIGRYTNWSIEHTALAAQPWCCIGDLMAFCDKYEFKAVSASDTKTHNNIVNEVRALMSGKAPFDIRKRFPSNIRSPENLMVCLGRCPSVEYHLGRIQSAFRKPLDSLSPDKQRIARQNFHLAIRELRLDISARVTGIRLYDQKIFERDYKLTWEDTLE